MPQSSPAGLTRTHVLQALADLDAGVDHPFGQPTGYELHHEGKRYPPKVVVGLACRYSLGRVLLPEEFSGSEAPGRANFVLRKLGFTVLRKGEGSLSRIPMPPVIGRSKRFGSSWRITSPCSKPSCRGNHTRSLSTARR